LESSSIFSSPDSISAAYTGESLYPSRKSDLNLAQMKQMAAEKKAMPMRMLKPLPTKGRGPSPE